MKTATKAILWLSMILWLNVPVMCRATESPQQGWYACTEDVECIVVPGSSCFEQGAVNSNYLQEFRKWRAHINSLAECTARKSDDPHAVARCVNNFCILMKAGQ